MSLLSRMTAPTARHDVAQLVAALLAEQPRPRAVPTGPTGLGTSAARVTPRREPSSDGVPELYCPPALRDDPALGREVNDRLVDWAGEVGIYEGRLDHVRAADFGRLMMLAHPDSDDPDRLLAAGKCALAEWATDDYYCDDGADPEQLGSHLARRTRRSTRPTSPSATRPRGRRRCARTPSASPCARRWSTSPGTPEPSQLARLRHEVAVLFVAYGQEGSWRSRGHMPTVPEYLAHRQINSFLPCIALADAVGGYALTAAEYGDPRVRRAVTMAATAATLVNDLYSMTKEHGTSGVEFNLPTVIADRERCSPREGIERSAEVHDELVRTYEVEAAALALTGSPQLRRFLAGVWAWLGGNRAWHSGSPRYNSA
ncbi:family 2 encapsulin nanocompartment cargo protein terpene cyclase [Streptomyces thioluteus]|uniref:2-methylisoborneol synthase n=1 Tax=Streptomyces thioluteus TaxID=66431 RepID=A0ABN3WM26_STRTU